MLSLTVSGFQKVAIDLSASCTLTRQQQQALIPIPCPKPYKNPYISCTTACQPDYLRVVGFLPLKLPLAACRAAALRL